MAWSRWVDGMDGYRHDRLDPDDEWFDPVAYEEFHLAKERVRQPNPDTVDMLGYDPACQEEPIHEEAA